MPTYYHENIPKNLKGWQIFNKFLYIRVHKVQIEKRLFFYAEKLSASYWLSVYPALLRRVSVVLNYFRS